MELWIYEARKEIRPNSAVADAPIDLTGESPSEMTFLWLEDPLTLR